MGDTWPSQHSFPSSTQFVHLGINFPVSLSAVSSVLATKPVPQVTASSVLGLGQELHVTGQYRSANSLVLGKVQRFMVPIFGNETLVILAQSDEATKQSKERKRSAFDLRRKQERKKSYKSACVWPCLGLMVPLLETTDDR